MTQCTRERSRPPATEAELPHNEGETDTGTIESSGAKYDRGQECSYGSSPAVQFPFVLYMNYSRQNIP